MNKEYKFGRISQLFANQNRFNVTSNISFQPNWSDKTSYKHVSLLTSSMQLNYWVKNELWQVKIAVKFVYQ